MKTPATNTVPPVLTVNNVEVIYDHVILVLKGVSLQVPQGKIVALLGANGAGKSTTLKTISTLLRGEVIADGPVQTLRARDPLTTGNPARRFMRLVLTPITP